MGSKTDVRWKQRFLNYEKTLKQLQGFLAKKGLSPLEEQGLIKTFEYTYELAWNTIKDFYESQGETHLQGSRDVIRLAFKRELIEDGQGWMDRVDRVDSRIQTVHTYDEKIAKKVISAIFNEYSGLFLKLQKKFASIAT